MNKLTVFYDANCGMCAGFRRWMASQPAHVTLDFLPYDSRRAAELCPDLLEQGGDRRLIVMADDGRRWQGAGAWVTCLWALRRWRGWSRRLASPVLLPFAGQICKLISCKRLTVSRLLGLKSDRELAGLVESMTKSLPAESGVLARAKASAGRGRP